MIGSGGLTSFSLGMGARAYPVSGPVTFASVFDNSTPSFVCQAPGVYNPIPTDNRKIVMQFNEGNGWQTLPAMAINSVPYAMYSAKAQNAQSLNGKADTSFVEYSTLASLNCQANEAIKFNGVSFGCIATSSGTTVTSGSVVTALGYTPADSSAVNATMSSVSSTVANVSSTVASVSSTVFAVSSTVSSLAGSVSSLQNTVAASFAAITSSQWSTNPSGINYSSGNVGINTASPTAKFSIGNSLQAESPGLSFITPKNIAINDTLSGTSGIQSQMSIISKADAPSNSSMIDMGLAIDQFIPASSSVDYGVRYGLYNVIGHYGSGSVNQARSTVGVIQNMGSGNINSAMAGTFITANMGAGNMTTAYGVDSQIVNQGTGNINTAYGLSSVIANTSGAASITTAYGLYLSKTNYGIIVNDYGIYQADSGVNYFGGNIGPGNMQPTARVHLGAGGSTLAPFKFTSGTLLTSPQSGTMEYDGSNYYLTDGANQRRIIATASSQGVLDNTSQINSTSNLTLNPAGSVVVSATTPSTNSNNGALVVKGGLGVAGNINAGGNLNVSGSTVIDGSLKLSGFTSGSVLFAGSNGTVSQNNSKFFWNGNLGLGTNAPSASLEVKQTSATVKITSTDGVSPTFLTTNLNGLFSGYFGTEGIGGTTFSNSLTFSTIVGTGSAVPLQFATNGSVKSTILVNGNMGIGTTAPGRKLHIQYNNSSSDEGLMIENQGDAGANLSFKSSGAGGREYMWISTGSANSTGAGYMGLYDNTGGGYRMVVNSSGNVGIGTNTPQQKLDVSGSVLISAGDLIINSGKVKMAGVPGNPGIVSTFLNQTTTNANSWIFEEAISNWGIYHYNTDDATAAQNSIMMTNAGSVGWNNLTFPSLPAGARASIILNNENGNGYFAGKIGVGTTAPTAPLHVTTGGSVGWNSVMKLETTSANTHPLMMFRHGGSDTAYVGFGGGIGTDNGFGIYNYLNADLTFGTSSTTMMTFKPSGNIGIGTGSPVTKLDVRGPNGSPSSFTSGTLAINNGGVAVLLFGTDDTTTSAEYAWIQSHGTRPLYINKVGNNTILNSNGGSVGIGTSTPTTRLEVAGGDVNIPTGRMMFNSGTTSGTAGIANTDAGSIFGEHDVNSEVSRLVIEVFDNTNDQIVLRTNAQSGGSNVDMVKVQYDQVVLAPTTGNVGVGVTTPTSKLQVNGGIKQPNYGQLIITFDGTTRTVSMPAFLTSAYIDAHQDETYTWRGIAPKLKDTVGCAAGPHPNYFFEGFDTTWNGVYRMTLAKLNATNYMAEIEWRGWGTNLKDAAGAVVATSSNQGTVQATLHWDGSVWSVAHMQGQVGATPFSCH